MITFLEANLKSLATGSVGSKIREEGVSQSQIIDITDDDYRCKLLQHLMGGVRDTNNYYSLKKQENICQKIVDNVFRDECITEEQATNFITLMYDTDTRLKRGTRLFIAYFKNVEIDGEYVDAIGLFLMPQNDTLITYDGKVGFCKGTLLRNVENSAIIFNTKNEAGENICIVTEKGTEWMHQLLRAEISTNDFSLSCRIMNACLYYINYKIGATFDVDASVIAKLLYENNKYFKNNAAFYPEHYAAAVFANEEVYNDFKNYLSESFADIPYFVKEQYDIDEEAYRIMKRRLSADVKIGQSGIAVKLNKEPKIEVVNQDEEMFYKIKVR